MGEVPLFYGRIFDLYGNGHHHQQQQQPQQHKSESRYTEVFAKRNLSHIDTQPGSVFRFLVPYIIRYNLLAGLFTSRITSRGSDGVKVT